jgi:hypothetical protein
LALLAAGFFDAVFASPAGAAFTSFAAFGAGRSSLLNEIVT